MNKVTEAKIKQWKQKWGEVHQIDVPLDDDKEGEVATGYFRKPDLQTISAAGKFTETDPIRSGMILFENCLLECDDELKNNDEAKLSAIKQLGGLFRVRAARIKKL